MDRESLVIRAKLAEHAERYSEMVAYVKDLVSVHPNLSSDERKLLANAYKNQIGALFLSWCALSSIRPSKKKTKQTHILTSYRKQIETELTEQCREILGLLSETLIPHAMSKEARVFFYTMKGDFNRFLLECQVGQERKASAEAALAAYDVAINIASTYLPATHPVRLGLSESFSACYEEGELGVHTNYYGNVEPNIPNDGLQVDEDEDDLEHLYGSTVTRCQADAGRLPFRYPPSKSPVPQYVEILRDVKSGKLENTSSSKRFSASPTAADHLRVATTAGGTSPSSRIGAEAPSSLLGNKVKNNHKRLVSSPL